MAHLGPNALAHLPEATVSVKNVGSCPYGVECEVCAVSKAHQIVARQTPDSTSPEPRYRVLVDWFSPGLASDGHEKYLLFKDEFSGFGWIFLCPHNDVNSVRHFESFFTYIQNQYRVSFKALRIDKEPHISTAQLVTYLDELGVDYKEVPTATPAQGGGYERARGVINAKARAIFIATRFAERDLGPEGMHKASFLR